MSREFPYMDKNSERKMLFYRCRQLKNHLGGLIITDSVPTGGFLFRDGQDKIDNIDKGSWTEFGENDYWGYREQYCWFKQTVTVPESFAGKKVVYSVTPFPDSGWDGSAQQFIIFVNGKQIQGLDHNHTFIFLADKAEGGESFDIALSAYCDDWEFRGPTRLKASLGVFNDDVNRLYYDLENLLELADVKKEDDYERVDIVKAVNDACNLLELCTPDSGLFHSSVKAADEYLHKTVFGADYPASVSAIGHTHIDTAWKWRLRQTRDKAGRSFATVINLMKEFPEYKFMSPQAQLYDFVKQDYPALYEEIKKAVKDGRWEAEGSMWVESDTNVISGESLVRQFMFGKRFFKNEFGVENRVMWLPDVFGYSGAVPQIMKKSGIDYFMTTKISWNEYDRFPYDTFTWAGIDGTEVLAHFEPSTDNDDKNCYNTTYNAEISPRMAVKSWQRYSNKDLNSDILCSFGHGDGGGGPTRGMIENIRRMNEGMPGCPKVNQVFVRDFFEKLDKDVSGSKRLPKWRGELYLEYHRGTLTAQARNKKYNRKSEFALHDAETLAETAHLLAGADYPAETVNEAWKLVLLNQFHDIIPGSSIFPVYEDSKAQYEKVLADARAVTHDAKNALAAIISTDGSSVTVFNTLGFERTDIADAGIILDDHDFEPGNTPVIFDGEKSVPTQAANGRILFLAGNVPAKGYKTFRIGYGTPARGSSVKLSDDLKTVETDFYTLRFDGDMNIASLYFKKADREVAAGQTLGRLTAYEDRSHQYEAWDIKCYYDEKSWDIDCVDGVRLAENGEVRTVIEIERHFNTSTIKQSYIFRPDTERIDIAYDIDWKENHVAVKADYPVDVNTGRATFDIQFGNIERSSTNNTLADYAQFEVCGHKWADLSDNGFGLSVFSDCKYGWTVKDGHIRPTLLRSATDPNYAQDRERHEFTYSLYPHTGAVETSDAVKQSYSLNVPFETAVTDKHEGRLPAVYSLMNCSADNVIIETVKKAEDSDALIIRMYEAWNKTTPCTLTLAENFKEAFECDLMEENDRKLDADGNQIKLTFKPFEIKTVKIV